MTTLVFIDDAVARSTGRDDGLEVHGSLWLLIRSFKNGILDRTTIEGTVSDLIRTGMRLPIASGVDVFPWAQQMGLLP